MTHITAFSDLVEKIYDAAFTPSIWPEIPRHVTELHEGSQGMLFAVRLPGVEEGFMFTHGIRTSELEVWNSGIAQDDIWVKNGIAKGLFRTGNVVRGEELVPDHEFLASDFYHRFLLPQDSRYLLSGVLFDGATESFPTSVCSVIRGHASRTFDMESVQLHRLISNHLSKSMATMWRLRSREMEIASTYSALDRLPTAVLLMNPGGRVAFANRTALTLLAKGDGIGLRAGPEGDSLVLSRADEQRKFDEMVKASVSSERERRIEHFSAGLKVTRPSGNLDYVVQVAPLGAQSGFSAHAEEHRAVVFVSDPSEKGKLDGTMLSTVYSLTPAEIRLAEALLAGDPLADTAAALGIKESTARTQLLAIFEKTRTSRQAQLIKLLLSMRMPG